MMRSLSRRRNERHIASKHGFGPADEQATRMAILTPPVTTTQVTKKKSVTGGRTNARRFHGFVEQRGRVLVIWASSPTSQQRTVVEGCIGVE